MLSDAFSLTGKVAVVTGGGKGLGAGIATTFAEAGADVVIAARTAADLDAVAARVRASGRRAVTVPLDVTADGAMERLVAATTEEFGRIDIVVNNAGGTAPRPFLDTSREAFEAALRFNVVTAFDLSRRAAPHLLDSRGCIINMSSAMGHLADRGYAAYSTSKAAVEQLTRLLARDLAPKVRVNAIAPGSIATDSLAGVLDDRSREIMIGMTPLHRLGEVRDIALAALYLASPAAAFVTGKVLQVDGGIETPNLSLGFPDL